MSNYIYIAASLDNYIATIDDGLEWLDDISNPEKSDFGFSEFISKIDAIVMGRRTYEKVLTFNEWPYSKPVFVLSNSSFTIPKYLSSKIEIINGDIAIILNKLQTRGFTNIYIDGGKVIQSFLDADLLDELIITRVPILLGDGIPLFGKLSKPLKFIHFKTEILSNELTKSYYKRIR